jgi:hypothetical protein
MQIFLQPQNQYCLQVILSLLVMLVVQIYRANIVGTANAGALEMYKSINYFQS